MYRLIFLGLLALAAATNYGIPEREPTRLHFTVEKKEPEKATKHEELLKTVEQVAKIGAKLKEMGYGEHAPEMKPRPVPELKPLQDAPKTKEEPPKKK